MQSYIIVRKLNLFKSQREFLVLDGVSHEVLLTAIEERPNLIQKILRVLKVSQASLNLSLFSKDQKRLVSFRKGFTWFASSIVISDSNNQIIAFLKRNLFGVDGEKYYLQTEDGQLNLKLKFDSGTLNYKFITESDVYLQK